MKHHGKKLIDELCNYLGQDLEQPMCRELLEHVRECPECRSYIESIRLTVSLLKKTKKEEPVPESVKKALFNTLKINQ